MQHEAFWKTTRPCKPCPTSQVTGWLIGVTAICRACLPAVGKVRQLRRHGRTRLLPQCAAQLATMPMPPTRLIITRDESTLVALRERAARMAAARPDKLSEFETAVLFMRGVVSRAAMLLPAYYFFLGATCTESKEKRSYDELVLSDSVRFSSLSTIALVCRKVFDHDPKGMTGRHFAKCSIETFERLGAYWAETSGRSVADAMQAIALLQIFFNECSDSTKVLLEGETALHLRLGLLKQYANNAAAHMTMNPFEIAFLDCAHPVAALAIIGSIIQGFDEPGGTSQHFNTLDATAWACAAKVFPDLVGQRLFDSFDVHQQGTLYWKWDTLRGRDMLLKQLPYAIGWF